LEAGTETLSAIASREDFLATGDPALREDAGSSSFQLLSYSELYELWERQQWATQDIDFSQDRIDWHERISKEERYQRMYGLSAFFIGEQRVTDELGPIMRAAPTEEMRIFLSTQIADEARHVRFFNRFYEEVGVLEGTDNLSERLQATQKHVNEAFGDLFDGMLKGRVDRLASEPENTELLVEAVTLYHMIIEGALALTGQHFIIEYNEEQGTLPGFVQGFQNVARDEHRHIAFGVRFLTDMAKEDARYGEAIQRMMAEALPIADAVLDPPWAEEDDWEMFGYSRDETHQFAAQCLSRRLKVIGLAA
jgi:ribonucleoside-diphosphate reductase beta chain